MTDPVYPYRVSRAFHYYAPFSTNSDTSANTGSGMRFFVGTMLCVASTEGVLRVGKP